MNYYRYTNLHWLNRCLLALLVIPALLTVIGITHGLYAMYRLRDLPNVQALSQLPVALRQLIHVDDIIRFSQISLTLLMLTFFFVGWLYYARRNLVALFEQVEHCLHNSVKQFVQLIIGIFFALRMMMQVWRNSTPDSHAHLAERWLVPLWWLFLIVANICKIVGVVHLHGVTRVGDWLYGYHWMLAAYVFYFVLYILTWRLVKKLSHFQHVQWQQRHLPLQSGV